jgi:hypothetical protein
MLFRFKNATLFLSLLLSFTLFLGICNQMNCVHATYGMITVQYLDGTPRPGADVWIIGGNPIGTTDSNGQVSCLSLSPGGYNIKALYPPGGSQFGSNTFLFVPDGATIMANYEITPPNITILSPQNTTYTNNTIPLTYTDNDFSPISWTGFSLDGQANTTITGNTTLTSLSFRNHDIIVYSNDTFGNMGPSSTVYFTVQNNGVVTIRVQYLDDSPRPGAVVRKISPSPIDILGTTNESGLLTISGVLSGPQDYLLDAWINIGTKFGDNTPIHVDANGDGSATITANYEITPPNINILSPQSQTYTSTTIPLTYTVNDFSPISWTGYNLDNQANTTITGNTTLNISFGTQIHSIVVFSNDSFGNMGQSGTVHFAVQRNSCIVRVQYLDGTPRPDAAIWIIHGALIGVTDSNGQVNCDALSPGAYNIWALYQGQQFGSPTLLVVPDGVTITADYEITPPTITTLSPQNTTYQNSSVPLTFTVYDSPSAISWTGYNLDGQVNVTVAGNVTMSGLSLGNHTVIVYSNDTFGNMGSSLIASFNVTIPGDINSDFKVSAADLVLLANAYGSKSGDIKWNPNADIDGDGIVDLIDLVVLANHYGQHYP